MKPNPVQWNVLTVGGLLLIAFSLLANPWLMEAWFSPDGAIGWRSRILIWTVEVILLAGGVYLWRTGRRVESAFAWIRGAYRSLAILLMNTVILFIGLNGIAALLPKRSGSPSGNAAAQGTGISIFREPTAVFRSDREVLRRLYPGRNDEEIWELINPPYSMAHPTLEFTNGPVRNRFYNVGWEGIRFGERVSAENVKDLIDGSTWVMGGSTAYGWGIADGETIVSELNRLDPGNVYLNFGVPSYGQNQEIEKLVNLLRKGYRPRRVWFLDGWNDLAMMRATRFHPVETPAKKQMAYGATANMDTLLETGWRHSLSRLPLIAAFRAPATGQLAGPLDPEEDADLYTVDGLYRVDPFRHYALVSAAGEDFAGMEDQSLRYQEKLAKAYRLNAGFLERLGRAFGFEWTVYLQPLGSLSPANPFLSDPESFRESGYHRYAEGVWSHIRSLVEKGELPGFRDISDTDARTGLEAEYTDACHYSAKLSAAVARSMWESGANR